MNFLFRDWFSCVLRNSTKKKHTHINIVRIHTHGDAGAEHIAYCIQKLNDLKARQCSIETSGSTAHARWHSNTENLSNLCRVFHSDGAVYRKNKTTSRRKSYEFSFVHSRAEIEIKQKFKREWSSTYRAPVSFFFSLFHLLHAAPTF